MRYLVISPLLLIIVSCYGQELAYRQFTVKDGLPGSIVYYSLQDKNGYIWFATNQGVSRFDGRTFTNFTKEDGLPDNEILKLYLDKFNNVWFISFMGVPSVFTNGAIKRFDNCKGVINICEDRQTDSIIFLTEFLRFEDSVLRMYRSPNCSGKWQFTEYRKKGLPESLVYESPTLQASSTENINFYFSVADKKKFELSIKAPTCTKRYFYEYADVWWEPLPFLKNSFLSVTNDQKAIVFASKYSLYFAGLNTSKKIISLKQLKLVFGNVNYLFCENDSTLWICCRDIGLVRIKNFLTSHYSVRTFFKKSNCTSIVKDREKGYWITTQGDGVYFLPNLDFYSFPNDRDIISQNAVSIRTPNKQFLVAGLADGNIIKLNHAGLAWEQWPGWTVKEKNCHIRDVWVLGDTAYVASDAGNYMVSGGITKKLPSQAMKGLFIKGSQLFAAGYDRIQLFDTRGNYKKDLFKSRSTCISGRDSTIYWGTLDGVYVFSRGSTQFLGKKYPALSGMINHIDIATDSSVWISTQQGIVVMKDTMLITIQKEQGLLSNTCKHISFDKQKAWVATNKGISVIDYHWNRNRMVYAISDITEEDGLITNDVNQTAVAGDYIWAATAAGICWFSKNYVAHSFFHPLININRIVSGNKSLPVTDTLQLHYPTGKLLIELSGISFRSGKQIKYEYRLKELDSNWNRTLNNVIEFSALPFGHFVFEVRAIDRWGVKSDLPQTIVIINTPPFWKTTWFLVLTYFILAASLGAAFYIYYRRRTQKREQEYRLKKKVHDLEMMALRAQMNPHFIFNCLTSIQYHIIRADIRNANAYLHKFSTLIRQILEHSTDSTILLREEIKILELYLDLEKLRLNDRMEYRLIVADDLDQDNIWIPTMIVQPHVENAIKHGIASLQNRKGILTIEIKACGDYIEFIIEDNGPGIHSTLKSKNRYDKDYISMGTRITGNRINAINAIQKNKILYRVVDKHTNEQPAGTIVYLSFPLIP